MKHLLTLAALLVSTLSLGLQMPYNPDANGDDFVGVDDVLGVLGVYDTALMQPDLTCDYEGTSLEQLFGGLIAGNLDLDSVYVEYLLVDSVTTYLPECPDPIVIETVLERSFTLTSIYPTRNHTNPVYECYGSFLGYPRNIQLGYDSGSGKFTLTCYDGEVAHLTSFGAYSNWNEWGELCCNSTVPLPFPSQWELNENGIEVYWQPEQWVYSCQSFRLIPFWHEAE